MLLILLVSYEFYILLVFSHFNISLLFNPEFETVPRFLMVHAYSSIGMIHVSMIEFLYMYFTKNNGLSR
jgi:hypothetical protein